MASTPISKIDITCNKDEDGKDKVFDSINSIKKEDFTVTLEYYNGDHKVEASTQQFSITVYEPQGGGNGYISVPVVAKVGDKESNECFVKVKNKEASSGETEDP